jgi:ABC-2 type transport system ATP-binding protein
MAKDNLSEVALSANAVYKDFKLPHEKHNSIKGAFLGAFKSRNSGYDVHHALRDITFGVKKGEFFGILGRNGSGKSTLLKILAEIYQPTKGKVRHEGKLVPFIELGVGFNPELTGKENVYLNGALLGFSKHEIDAKYDDIVDFAELREFMDQKLKNYSSGMQVRLAFSVATRAEADILLVDEVLAVGDADFQRKCYDYFKSLKKNKKTVIFVSHDMTAVREFCDRAILIDSSRIIAEGPASAIANKYSQLFLEKHNNDDDGESGNRWGDARAIYKDIKVHTPNIGDKDAELSFEVSFEAKKDIKEVIVAGSSITNAGGLEFSGTNTEIEKVKLKPMRQGDVQTLEWHYPNIFSNGRYYINITLHGANGNDVADWWTDAAHFDVKRNRETVFVVSPAIEVALKSGKR